MQLDVGTKDNEIVLAPAVLAPRDRTGGVVTGDALYTQRTLSTQVGEAGGDYVWVVQDNQREVRQDGEQLVVPELNAFGTAALPTDFTTARTLEHGQGRIEDRVLTTSSMLADYSPWPYLAQGFMLESTVTTARGTHTTVRYGVTSIPRSGADAARVRTLVRRGPFGCWGIEHGGQYRRDVTLAQDRSLVRMGHAPHMLAARTNTVLARCARHHWHNGATAQRTCSYRLERALVRLSRS